MSIHPLAVVSPGARLGVGVTVGPFATIETDVVLGDFCTVASDTVIKAGVGARRNPLQSSVQQSALR